MPRKKSNVSEARKNNLTLHDQIYLEARAMAEYALSNGKEVSVSAIQVLEAIAKDDDTPQNHTPDNAMKIAKLVKAHAALAKTVEPAKPHTILLLDIENKNRGTLGFLGPVSLIRQMMIAAIISLVLFITIGLSPEVNSEGGGVMDSDGIPLLLNLLFYLAAAGLGASFAALYKANTFITNGTFDPTYYASYWIRFFLGLIAGLILAVLISDDAFTDDDQIQYLEQGIIRPLLAILGGFSADLAYTVLSRLVETFQSLFRGSTSSLIASQVQEEKTRLADLQSQQQMKLVAELMLLQQKIGSDAEPEDMHQAINKLLNDIMPDIDLNQVETNKDT